MSDMDKQFGLRLLLRITLKMFHTSELSDWEFALKKSKVHFECLLGNMYSNYCTLGCSHDQSLSTDNILHLQAI